MKKSFLSMFAMAAGLLMATSCSNELENVQVGGDATVTFTAELPNLASRAVKSPAAATAFGDGTTATNLNYAVYKVGTDGAWTLIDDLSGNKTINLQTTVSLKLVNGNTYAVAFWAEAATGSIYTFDKATCTVTADYDGVLSSNESLDAFYAVKEFTVNGASQETVELHRPFAQLNIGTADLADSKAAGQEVLKAGITVKTYNTLALKDGAVSGEEEVTFDLATLPTENFPVIGYEYLTMNYLLMPADKKADNTVTITYDNANVPARTFNNVPLQRNYRTNIYGNLLTSTTDFNVIIKPEFDGEYENPLAEVTVTTTDELMAALAEGNSIIELAAGEYELGDATFASTTTEYTLVGADKENSIVKMQKSVYGSNVKLNLNNLTITTPTGLFYAEQTWGVFQFFAALNINNCHINGSLRSGTNGTTIENCDFSVATADRDDGYALRWYGQDGSTLNVKNCQFNVVRKAIHVYGESAMKANLVIENCQFVASTTATTGLKCAVELHSQLGVYGTLTMNNCTVSGNFDATKHNGIWAEMNNATKFTVTVDGETVQTAE